ncbi:MAG: AAA family ATPase [Clostridia bacterium]|nr:AAA family ATPase [Clostridia bacterium]
MPRIITFTSPKGGCGSSFVCASLWYILTNCNEKVMALDMCYEKCTLDYALGFQNDYVYTLSDVIAGSCSLEEAVSYSGNSCFLRSDYEQNGMDYDIAAQLLRESDYDYILIDMPPFSGDIAKGILSFSDELIIVSDCTAVSAKLCDSFLNDIGSVKARLVINKIIPSYIKDGIHLTVDELLDMLGIELLGLAPYDECVEIILKNGVSQGLEVELFREVFGNMALRLTGERIPAADIASKKPRNFLVKGRK